MPQYFNLTNYDVIFLSYDEPNADKNYQQLVKNIPWAKRVHGIKGSDTAHKECAKLGTTDRIIIIDGDNWLDGDLLNQSIELNDEVDHTKSVFSWPAKNVINGLMYGNGGIKCWNRETIFNIKTHENCFDKDSKSSIDFCWDLNYISFETSYSTLINNESRLQAWRAGFREGVKLSLDNGKKVNNLDEIASSNLNRLKIWMSVGDDILNGIWAILGARQGCYLTNYTDWDFTQIKDFDWLNSFYDENIKNLTLKDANLTINEIGKVLSKDMILSSPFSKNQSIFFKSFKFNSTIQNTNVRNFKNHRYDIVMITYHEPNAEENYKQLIKRFPHARRINGVQGIHNAHIEAAKIVNTEMFWVVDGDALIDDNFNFSYHNDPDDYVRVWRCKNPVNDLIYGYGGIKLLPREKTLNLDVNTADMTTSISNNYIPINELSNITNFNTDPFNAWRSAFRECAKLSSKIIDRQKDIETLKRLKIWCTKGKNKPYGIFVIDGAREGKKYGEQNKNNLEALKKINDFNWLKNLYSNKYPKTT